MNLMNLMNLKRDSLNGGKKKKKKTISKVVVAKRKRNSLDSDGDGGRKNVSANFMFT